MKKRKGTAAVQILQDILGWQVWRADREWGGKRYDLWNGRDFVAIQITPLPPSQGVTRVGKRTRVLNFHELTVLECPEQCAQVVEWVLEKG